MFMKLRWDLLRNGYKFPFLAHIVAVAVEDDKNATMEVASAVVQDARKQENPTLFNSMY